MKLSLIDDSNRADHSYLEQDDNCFFMHEYTSGQGFAFGKANQLILNLKKSVLKRGTAQWRYKGDAIRSCAIDLTGALNKEWLRTGTLVPVPPSKHRDHPEYDDRMLQICRAIQPGFKVDVRELVIQKSDLPAFHASSSHRMRVEELESHYAINPAAVHPIPTAILLIDDVLTAGTHFKAMKRVLLRTFPKVVISGAFIARRVFPNPFETVDD